MGHKHLGAVAAMAALAVSGTASADQIVQIPVDALLDARAVTTLTGGRLVTWTVGIDGNGNSDGYMTAAASKFHGDPSTLETLPDDGKFPADARHPEVVLHFSNDAPATSQQTHYVRGAGRFSFAVPSAVYSKLFLFVTSSEGSSSLRVSLMYADTTDTISITVPDYYVDVPANDPVVFNLATNLPKWNQQNNVAEANHHNLTGLEIRPAAGKTLSGITIDKTAPGYFVFWGATGLAVGPDADAGSDATTNDATVDVEVDVDAGSGGAGGTAGAAGAGGGSGSGGLAGASGAAVGTGGSAASGGAAGSDRAASNATDAGCACRSSGAPGSGLAGFVLLLAALVRRRFRGS